MSISAQRSPLLSCWPIAAISTLNRTWRWNMAGPEVPRRYSTLKDMGLATLWFKSAIWRGNQFQLLAHSFEISAYLPIERREWGLPWRMPAAFLWREWCRFHRVRFPLEFRTTNASSVPEKIPASDWPHLLRTNIKGRIYQDMKIGQAFFYFFFFFFFFFSTSIRAALFIWASKIIGFVFFGRLCSQQRPFVIILGTGFDDASSWKGAGVCTCDVLYFIRRHVRVANARDFVPIDAAQMSSVGWVLYWSPSHEIFILCLHRVDRGQRVGKRRRAIHGSPHSPLQTLLSGIRKD